MKRINSITLILTMLLMTSVTLAEEKTAPVPPPPNLPPAAADNDDSMQADVVIRKGKDGVVEEYRVNGELYMVRITPNVGKPYYIRYPDGEKGRQIRKDLDDINTPYWKLFEW